MVKVINISARTIIVANTEIKPKSVHIFEELSIKDKQKAIAFSNVGLLKVYEGDYAIKHENKNIASVEVETEKDTTTEVKSTRRSNKKK